MTVIEALSTLGFKNLAEINENSLRVARRKAIKLVHPDNNNSDLSDKASDINRAFDILCNEIKNGVKTVVNDRSSEIFKNYSHGRTTAVEMIDLDKYIERNKSKYLFNGCTIRVLINIDGKVFERHVTQDKSDIYNIWCESDSLVNDKESVIKILDQEKKIKYSGNEMKLVFNKDFIVKIILYIKGV